MSAHLLVCGVGSGMDRSLALLKDMGLRLTVVTDDVSDRVRAAADRVVPAYPRDHERVRSLLAEITLPAVDAMFTLGYEAPWTVAALAEHFGCRGTPMRLALDCSLKDRRLEIFQARGVPCPRGRAANSVDDAMAAFDEIGGAAVVKPNDKTSSIAVAKLRDRREAPALIRAALEESASTRVVVEEFLEGSEHTVEGFVCDGEFLVTGVSDRNYAEKERFAPYFFENGDTLPSQLPADTVAKLIEASEKAVRALGLDNEVFSNDLLLTPDGRVVVLEVACRLAGSRFGSEIVPLSTGVNAVPNAVRLALGWPLERAELEPDGNRPVVLRFRPATGGTVRRVGPLDPLIARDARIYDVFWDMTLEPGMSLPVYRNGKHLLAGVIATGDSLADAEDAAANALSDLPLTLETGGADADDPVGAEGCRLRPMAAERGGHHGGY